MVNSADFGARGVAFHHSGGAWSITGPNNPALMTKLRAEVERRVTAFTSCRAAGTFPSLPGVERSQRGACTSCASPLPTYRGGHCSVCHIAISKVYGVKP